MRAKKLISIALLAALGTSAQAQIVSSQSNQVIVTEQVKPVKPKKPWNGKIYLKAGLSIDMSNFEHHNGQNQGKSTSGGYEFSLGITNTPASHGFCWGIEMGGMSCKSWELVRNNSEYGGTWLEEVNNFFSLNLNPYIGWNIESSDKISISPHFGPFARYGEDLFRAGISVGTNVWIKKRYAVGLNYKVDMLCNSSDKDTFSKISIGFIYSF